MDEFIHSDVSAWAAEIADNDRPSQIVEAIGHRVETLTAEVHAATWQGNVYYFGINNDAGCLGPRKAYLEIWRNPF